MNDVNVEISLMSWQDEVYEAINNTRFVVVSAGRQSGKTYLGVALLFLTAFHDKQGSISWWVAPTYQNSKMAFRRLLDLLNTFGITEYKTNRADLLVEFDNGSMVFFKSSDREEGLRGETIDGIMIIDEMGLVKRDSWQYALRGTITATGAHVLFIGTPKGKNLFYELYLKGQDPKELLYESFQLESIASKYFSKDEWDEVSKLPARIFEQEYKAKFIDDGGEVFRNVKACVKGELDQPRHNKTYYAGVDLAKSHDYTVICILNQDGHLVAYDRFNDISWTVQKKRIIDLVSSYDAYMLIDSTGLGDPILDDLSGHVRSEGFKFSNTSKRQIIESLAIAIEREDISFPDIDELINELSTFTFDQTPGGLIRYNAPEGLHDDIVIALALAQWAWGGSRGSVDSFSDIDGREMTGEW